MSPSQRDIRYAALRDARNHRETTHRQRSRPLIDGPAAARIIRYHQGKRQQLVNWASNDYLGLISEITVRNRATRYLRRFGPGSGAARLLAGGLRCHHQFEQRLAHFVCQEDALITTSGYQANLAAMTSLADHRDDVLLLDRLAHASSYDGAALAKGTLARFRHNDVSDLAQQLAKYVDARRRVVVVESIYSMDGDVAPLREIADLCHQYDAWLVVDEAHALGVYGPGGRGMCAEVGITPDLIVGTSSKTLSSTGGWLAGPTEVIDHIVNHARSFIFSTAPTPASVGAALGSLDWLRKHSDAGNMLRARSHDMRSALREQGWNTSEGDSPIIPVIIGSEEAVLRLSHQLAERGHYAPPIRPPTVPADTCRLRISVTLGHREVDVRRFIQTMADLYESNNS